MCHAPDVPGVGNSYSKVLRVTVKETVSQKIFY